MKKYIKPAIEIIYVNTESIMAASPPYNPNSIDDQNGYSQPRYDEEDEYGFPNDM